MRSGTLHKLIIAALLSAAAALSLPVHAAPASAVTDWLLANDCTRTIWNAGIGSPLGHGLFHPEIASPSTARYGQAGRVNGSAAGGEWCMGSAVVGDNTAVGCWAAHAGIALGYRMTISDTNDLSYVECRGTTACNYIRTNLGGERACSSAPTGPDGTTGRTGSTGVRSLPRECLNGACLPQCGCTAPPPSPPPPARPTDSTKPLPAPPIVAIPKWILEQCARDRPPAIEVAKTKAWHERCDGITHARGYVPVMQSNAQLQLVMTRQRPAR